MNVIRCDLKEYIVWKWRPQFNDSNDSGKRSNFVRWGSSLRVKDGEGALCVGRFRKKVLKVFNTSSEISLTRI